MFAPIQTAARAETGDTAQASKPKLTRFLIGVPKNTTFHVSSLANPNRVVVELNATDIALPDQPTNGPVGLVSSFSGGPKRSGGSLIVINVTKPVIVKNAKFTPGPDGTGHYLSLDINGVDLIDVVAKRKQKSTHERFGKPAGLGATGIQPPLPRPAQSPAQRAARSAKHTIVIDPGHGGHDSGAEKNGIVEKRVVLAFALVLREKLEATGRYRVLMTRTTDRFVTLDDRREYAEKHNAHLFIAVHADYARSGARGATIYSLRDSVARSLKRSATRRIGRDIRLTQDNFTASPAQGSDQQVVRSILTNLERHEVEANRARSTAFSEHVINFMGISTIMRASPHKKAAFRVLKTAKVPSVLIELAYVTNKSDARKLASKEWRNKVSRSIVTAVDDYFETDVANIPM